MSIQVKRRREAAGFLASFVGASAELIVDTTNNRVQVHDGSTPGGWPAAKLAEVLINARTAAADANYVALPADRSVAVTALTAARTVALPAASAFPTGTTLLVFDESGACSAAKTITLTCAGTDVVDGAASAVIASAYGYLGLQSDGARKWTIVDQAASASQSFTALGVGAAADPGNPLSVYATSILMNSGGDARFKINKAAAANTASILYQDRFLGRAEIGLCGDDNFHFKVSPDGSTWYDALSIAASGGGLSLLSAPPAGDSSARVVTSAWFGQNLPGGFLNRFRNGAMDVWQRGTAPIAATTAGAYAADGWIVLPSGASCGAQAAHGRSATVNSLQVYGGAGVTDVIVKQRIESYLAASLSGQTVTVQAQLYNNAGVAITPKLTVKHAGSTDNWSAPAVDVNAVALQPCPNGAWTRLAYAFTASSSSNAGLEIAFDFGGNFGAGSNAIQITELDLRATPGAATGLVASPPPPELRPIASELALCQRYFEMFGAGAVARAVGAGAMQGFGAAFKATKRAAPTLALVASTPTADEIAVSARSAAAASLTVYAAATVNGAGDIGVSGWSGLTSGNLCVMTGDYFAASAEL